ncbi:MAG: serine hydrolase, partial [Rhodothermales bacterium]
MLQRFQHVLVVLATLVVFIAGVLSYFTFTYFTLSTAPSEEDLWPRTEEWAENHLEAMSLPEKVSQLLSIRTAEPAATDTDPTYEALVDLVEAFGIGGITLAMEAPMEQAALVNDLQRRTGIPLLVSQHIEWTSGRRTGMGMGTSFPNMMALGATRNVELSYLAGRIAGIEAGAVGVHHVFAPRADVFTRSDSSVRNLLSFGERPEQVSIMSRAFARGVQDAGALATAMQFPGRAPGRAHSNIGRIRLRFGMDRFETIELLPYQDLIEEGIMSIMMGNHTIPEIEPDVGAPAMLSSRVTTDLLRGRLGFNGIVVADDLDAAAEAARSTPAEMAVRALEAGADLLLLTSDPYSVREAVLRAVADGRLSERRIDASVYRLLRAKAWLDLEANRYADFTVVRSTMYSPDHLALSETIARRSATLLRNERDVLPLSWGGRVLSVSLRGSVSSTVDSIFINVLGRRRGGTETASRILDVDSEPDDYREVLEEAPSYDVVVVSVVQEAMHMGEIEPLRREAQDFLTRLSRYDVPIVLVAFGNPFLIVDTPQPEAYLVTYGASEATQLAAAEVLLGQSETTGRLPVSIPGRYAYGAGIDLPQQSVRPGSPAEVGLSRERLALSDSVIYSAIGDRAFPAAALAVGRRGVITKLEGYGYYTYAAGKRVTPHSLFDIASLTKVVATTTAAMKLYDEGTLDLDERVVHYLPEFGQSGKDDITIRQLLTHSAGLTPYRAFHQMAITTRAALIDLLMEEELVYRPGTESRYSDLGMITMMLVIERVTGQPFSEYVTANVFEPLGMHDTQFRGTGITDPTVVPTEVDAHFRRRLIQGEVHDETAWILGGVSGHAGVFSTVNDLAKLAFMLLNDGRLNGGSFVSPETIATFTIVQDPDLSTRALGWDTKAPEGYSSAGELFGPNSFGHTGFTGTFAWM